MPPSLSLCMIVKNEERDLPRCLESVRGLADELIIVDTGSTDSTPSIAAQHNAKLLPFDFSRVDFAAARNHGLAHATGRWILVLDADESLGPHSRPLISNRIALDHQAGYFLERHNHWPQKVTKDYAVRLFPNRAGHRYRGRVHETVDASLLAAGLPLHQTTIRIDHNFVTDPEARRRKNLLYIDILNEELADNPQDDSRLDFLAAEYHQLEMFDRAAEITERIARIRPCDPRAHLFAGIYHLLYKPDLAQARADFERALFLRPGYPEAESFLQTLNRPELR